MGSKLTVILMALGLALGLSSCTRDTKPPQPENKPPIASLEFEPKMGEAPLTVHFSAATSTDPDGQIASYSWDFGDGGKGTGLFTEHRYTKKGSFVVSLTVTDDKGATATIKRTVFITEPPEPPPGRTDTAQDDFIIYSRTLLEAVKPGETFTVQVTVTAKVALKAVVVSENLSEGLQLVSGELRAAQLGLSANQKLQFTYQVKAGAAPGTFTVSGKATPASDRGAQPTLELNSAVQIR